MGEEILSGVNYSDQIRVINGLIIGEYKVEPIIKPNQLVR
jgi:hypothetical protein